ncbi:heme utilization protein [Pseudomonas akapageensis]|uniref:heme utilization protein n=1 Tax=Pseudomonas akapageensis TaxID=2609961 RepID=UPI001407BB85|nr:heme utilization protein [Pseudomonas akapageensis]
MKPSMAIKPLVFAIAAVMAVAVQAGDYKPPRHHNHHNDHHHTPPPTKVPVYATANAYDKQSSTNNYIRNEGTVNNAEMNSSAGGSSGNVGINVAAGDGNQQDNAAAIANAQSDASAIDNSFVFGMATASARVDQYSNRNRVDNYGSTATATMSASANGGSGNLGVNIAGGDLNQQKNTMAIANTNAPLGNARADANATQNGPGLVVINNADRTFDVTTLSLTKTVSGNSSFDASSELHIDKASTKSVDVSGSRHSERSGSNSYDASGSTSYDASGSLSIDASGSRSHESHSTSSRTLDASVDATLAAEATLTKDNGWGPRTRSASVDASLNATLNVAVDKTRDKTSSSSFEKSFDASFEKSLDTSFEKSSDSSFNRTRDSSFEKSFDKSTSDSFDKEKSFSAASSFELSNTVTWQVLTPTGWANPVTNTATLSGSVTGASGNVGVNVAAGVGNQQSNSLSIANSSM